LGNKTVLEVEKNFTLRPEYAVDCEYYQGRLPGLWLNSCLIEN
jgi:hypothetical protein